MRRSTLGGLAWAGALLAVLLLAAPLLMGQATTRPATYIKFADDDLLQTKFNDTLCRLDGTNCDATQAELDLKLSLSGDTMTGELTADELGIEFQETDAITDCSGFSATGGGFFYDDSEGAFKKCQENVLSLLVPAGTGETNTHSSLGGGLALTAGVPKSGVDLQLVSLDADDFNSAGDVVTTQKGSTVLHTANALDNTTVTATNQPIVFTGDWQAGDEYTGSDPLAEWGLCESNQDEVMLEFTRSGATNVNFQVSATISSQHANNELAFFTVMHAADTTIETGTGCGAEVIQEGPNGHTTSLKAFCVLDDGDCVGLVVRNDGAPTTTTLTTFRAHMWIREVL